MADYSVTAASVIASPSATYFAPNVLTQPTLSTSARPNVNTAGTTITAGQPVYQDPTTMQFSPADANAASPLYDVVGIAMNNAALGQPLIIVTADPQFTPGCTLAIGDIMILSGTLGRVCPSADAASGWFVATLGVAYSTTQMKLQINKSGVAK